MSWQDVCDRLTTGTMTDSFKYLHETTREVHFSCDVLWSYSGCVAGFNLVHLLSVLLCTRVFDLLEAVKISVFDVPGLPLLYCFIWYQQVGCTEHRSEPSQAVAGFPYSASLDFTAKAGESLQQYVLWPSRSTAPSAQCEAHTLVAT
eukprot:5536110-Amphidinium_carterae.1